MKRETIIIDLDGVIFKKTGNVRHDWYGSPSLLPGISEWFWKWEKESACIIIMTARPECLREQTEAQLMQHRLFWDQLVMGVGHGWRWIINDSKEPVDGRIVAPSCFAVTIPRNQGLEHYELHREDA